MSGVVRCCRVLRPTVVRSSTGMPRMDAIRLPLVRRKTAICNFVKSLNKLSPAIWISYLPYLPSDIFVSLYLCQSGDNLPPKGFQRFDLVYIRHIKDDLLNADGSQGAALLYHVCWAHLLGRKMGSAERGLLDLGVIPSYLLTMSFQDIQLVTDSLS